MLLKATLISVVSLIMSFQNPDDCRSYFDEAKLDQWEKTIWDLEYVFIKNGTLKGTSGKHYHNVYEAYLKAPGWHHFLMFQGACLIEVYSLFCVMRLALVSQQRFVYNAVI